MFSLLDNDQNGWEAVYCIQRHIRDLYDSGTLWSRKTLDQEKGFTTGAVW